MPKKRSNEKFRIVGTIDKSITARNLGLPDNATPEDVYALIAEQGDALFAEGNGLLTGLKLRVLV